MNPLSENLYFPKINKIKYSPDSKNDDVLCFRHYNENEIIMGRKMSEWLRFAVCFWHTFVWQGNDIFGSTTFDRPWNNKDLTPMEQAKHRIQAAFEFFEKLGVKYYTFHDRDFAPEGDTLEESNKNLDEIVSIAEELQKKTGVKLLWGTANLFSNKRYMNGAGTNPDVHAFAYAGSQVKKMLEVTHRLKGENFVFWGGREGYQCLLNTNVKKELDHMAVFLKMASDYKKKIGFEGQLLIEPKAKEPTKHQYDFDTQTVLGFLKTYNLYDDFKLNIEPNHSMLSGHSFEHDIHFASAYNMLGSIDMNTGEPSLGWDTDNFLFNGQQAVLIMLTVLKQNGLGKGGLNFDCKVRRESTDLEDLFISHIAAMDTMAYALKKSAKIIEDGVLDQLLNDRYISYSNTDLGKKVENGTASLEECEEYILKNGETKLQSAKQEKFERILNNYLN